ncbi:hypothetical protein [Massilia rubra]|uniref:Uncharacterized protein n=1 Tax=Massilia rubra TaxID=2607910 RepID=A0ABX0M828_9BURK|nr:hypothetical protein [Massilia rubra]NHZ38346.1 hypothetical protein [Massilia rubra]
MKDVVLGIDFARAVAEHFNLPGDATDANMVMGAGPNEVFGVRLKLMLSPDDVAAIAARMGGVAPTTQPKHWAGKDQALSYVRADGVEQHIRVSDNNAAISNFDAWMRARTEAAHAAYMARHIDGGQDYQ